MTKKFVNLKGESQDGRRVVFPIILVNEHDQTENGTAFFIAKDIFVTAKHVLFKDESTLFRTIRAAHLDDKGNPHYREIVRITPHADADIAIGQLKSETSVASLRNPMTLICKEKIEIGDRVSTFAYPSTKIENITAVDDELEFSAKFYEGEILGHLESTGKLKSGCFATSMNILGGASGGPVFRNGRVVGINSTSFNEDTSIITPIQRLLEMEIRTKDGLQSLEELLSNSIVYRI